MKLEKKLIILFILVSSLLLISSVSAQNYTLLDPSILGENAVSTPSFTDYIEKIFKTFLIIVVSISLLMIIIGGLEYTLSSLPNVKQNGLSRAKSAVGGLFLALISVLFLQTINPDLVDFNLNFLNTKVGQNIPSNIILEDENNPGNNTIAGGNGNRHSSDSGSAAVPTGEGHGSGQYGEVPSNEFDVRKNLKDNGISINDEDTCRINNPAGCRTYVGSMNATQIESVKSLKRACGCTVIISGAAEQGGHSSDSRHYDGNAVDVRTNPTLNSYINTNKDSMGLKYYQYEGNHWHLEF